MIYVLEFKIDDGVSGRSVSLDKNNILEDSKNIAHMGLDLIQDTLGFTAEWYDSETNILDSESAYDVIRSVLNSETVRRQMIWHKSSKKLRETFIYYSSVLLVHT